MPPFLGGGTMIGEVTLEGFTPADIPAKFEAGTQPVAEAVGLGAAIEWLKQFDWNDIEQHEQSLMAHAHEQLSAIDGLRILGPSDPRQRSGCISFSVAGFHPHDLVEALREYGLCVRAGHHCAQPLHRALKVGASSRLSLAIFSVPAEIEALFESIQCALARIRT